MKHNISFILLSTTSAFIFSGCVGTSLMDTKVSAKKARMIFTVPAHVSAEKVKKALYDGISYRVSDMSENENFLPETLEAKAQTPKRLNAFGGMSTLMQGNPKFAMMQVDTTNAYYTVQGSLGMNSGFNAKSESYKGAIYPSQEGYKVYIYQFYQEGSDGLMGKLIDASIKSIVGKDSALVYAAQIRDNFLKELPEAKVSSIQPSKLARIKLNVLGVQKK